MMRRLVCLMMFMSSLGAVSKTRDVTFYWVNTSDVHSSIFCYDYLKNKPTKGGLSAVYSYVENLRKEHPNHVICTDNGDCLQGQPIAYYYNFIDTVSPHLITEAMNAMKYDCGTIGNHDIETGHAVYDRWIRELNYPMLGANVIDVRTNKPYLKPYHIIERDGVRIAVLGMTTPAIPNWLPETLWKGLYFEDILESTRKWVDYIQKKEKPHLLVGLFHSGLDGGIVTDKYCENATKMVVEQVAGFDLILYGHDHMYAVNTYQNPLGEEVPVIGPTSMGARIAQAEIHLTMKGKRIVSKKIVGSTPLITGYDETNTILFEEQFRDERKALEDWMDMPIGEIDSTICERDAFFGSSHFIDMIHELQLKLTGADVSFAAPLSYDSRISKGQLSIRNMFSLYKYENFLYTMRMTGAEIKGFLEMSYALWTNQMKSPNDHIMLLDNNLDNGRRQGFKNFAFNFDSAAGIRYTVDVTKPQGEKITIESMADGSPFDMSKTYKVAVNSYRGNGGGELMTKGAGIPHDQLKDRIIQSTEKDLRYYLIQYVREHKKLHPQNFHLWRYVPDEWAVPAINRDRLLLFPDEK